MERLSVSDLESLDRLCNRAEMEAGQVLEDLYLLYRYLAASGERSLSVPDLL